MSNVIIKWVWIGKVVVQGAAVLNPFKQLINQLLGSIGVQVNINSYCVLCARSEV